MTFIKLDQVSIDFPIYGMRTRSLRHQLFRRANTGGNVNANLIGKKPKPGHIVTVRALDNLSLTIDHGDRVGVVGHNGAGKSTLLRVLASIYSPTAGTVSIQGNVSALLDIMMGMSPEASGYDNIVLRGLLQGLNYKQIALKRDEIAEFTELGDYLAMPVRTYSTGMQLRLAFAIATSVTPEILILDEVINTGDETFLRKAELRIKEFIHTAEIVVVASHDLQIIKDICNKVLWMERGAVVYYGEMNQGLELYTKST